MILYRIRRAGRLIATKATGLLVGTSLLLTMLSSSSWSETGSSSGLAPAKPKPQTPGCGTLIPEVDPRQMIGICAAEVSKLEKQRQRLVLDRQAPRNALHNIDVVIHEFKEVIRGERKSLGEDPGPDSNPGFTHIHGHQYSDGRRPTRGADLSNIWAGSVSEQA
jgi:hypothetical protein